QCLIAVAEAAIDGGSGDVKEATQSRRRVEDRLKQALRGLDVAGPVAVKVGPAFDEAGLGGDVADDLRPGKDSIERIGAKVEAMEREAGPALETGEVAARDG